MSVKKYTTKNGETKWYASARYTDWTGKRRQRKREGFDRRGDALAWEREFLLQNGRSCDMSFASLVELYRDDAAHRTRGTTQDTQGSIVEKWLLPFFGALKVDEIDAVAIRRWQNKVMSAVNPRNGKKYADTYIRSMNSRLSAILNYAVKYYGLKQNPCHIAGFMGKKKAGKMKFWTTAEFNQAMGAVTNWSFRVAFLILYWTGLRVGECLALQVADVLPSKALHVEKTYHRKNGEDTSGPPKTDNSYRDVSMPDFLYDEVMRYIEALYDVGPGDRIFYFVKGTLNDELDKAAAAAGVKRIRVHDLRHSHAALLVEMGYSIVAVAERLGDTVEVAMSTYSHLYPDKMGAVAVDLNRRAADEVAIAAALENAKKDADF